MTVEKKKETKQKDLICRGFSLDEYPTYQNIKFNIKDYFKISIVKVYAIGGSRIALTPANAMVQPKVIVLNSEKSKKGATYV